MFYFPKGYKDFEQLYLLDYLNGVTIFIVTHSKSPKLFKCKSFLLYKSLSVRIIKTDSNAHSRQL